MGYQDYLAQQASVFNNNTQPGNTGFSALGSAISQGVSSAYDWVSNLPNAQYQGYTAPQANAPVNAVNGFSAIGAQPMQSSVNTMGNSITPFTGIAQGMAASPVTAGANATSTFSPISGTQSIGDLIAGANANNVGQFSPISGGTTDTASWFSGSNVNPSNWTAAGIGQGIGAAKGLFDVYSGWQSMNLAEDQFNFSKDAWQTDYNQRKESYDYEIARREGRDRAAAGTA
jgi:hypothetical protein